MKKNNKGKSKLVFPNYSTPKLPFYSCTPICCCNHSQTEQYTSIMQTNVGRDMSSKHIVRSDFEFVVGISPNTIALPVKRILGYNIVLHCSYLQCLQIGTCKMQDTGGVVTSYGGSDLQCLAIRTFNKLVV